MVSFRRGSKKRRMQEKKTEIDARGGLDADASSVGEIRVTDRRRVRMDGAGSDIAEGEGGGGDQASGLKPTYVEELEAQKRAAEQKVTDVQARFEQLRAELRRETDETRQRLNRAADDRARGEKAAFVAALLPVIDNLRRAINAAEGGGSVEALLDGLRGTVNNFESALAQSGVEAVRAVGGKFDPQLHEAVDTIEVDSEQDEAVIAEYSCGYRLGDRLLRPARVQVGRARSAAEAKAHKTAEQDEY